MGELILTSRGGQSLFSIILKALVAIVLLCVAFVLIYLSGKDSGGASFHMSTIVLVVIVILFIVIDFGIAYFIIRDIYFWKTRLEVYENGIKGLCKGRNMFSVRRFHLLYEQISNVEVIDKRMVIVYSPYGRCLCYALNSEEICDRIYQQKEKRFWEKK